MSIVKNILVGLISGSAKVLKGVGKGIEDGLEELGNIPANIRFDRKQKLSGRYVVDLDDGKTVTIKFNGALFMWDIEEYCGKPLSDDEWNRFSDYEMSSIHSKVNSWANNLFRKHGLRV